MYKWILGIVLLSCTVTNSINLKTFPVTNLNTYEAISHFLPQQDFLETIKNLNEPKMDTSEQNKLVRVRRSPFIHGGHGWGARHIYHHHSHDHKGHQHHTHDHKGWHGHNHHHQGWMGHQHNHHGWMGHGHHHKGWMGHHHDHKGWYGHGHHHKGWIGHGHQHHGWMGHGHHHQGWVGHSTHHKGHGWGWHR